METSELLSWDASHGRRFTHDLFKFPGKFHPPIVENIIRRTQPRLVLDPMGGVGTVTVEAMAQGVSSWYIDIDPLSAFLARVKSTPLPARTLRAAKTDLDRKVARYRRTDAEIQQRMFQDIRQGDFTRSVTRYGRPDLSTMDYWFRKYALVDFAQLDHHIHNGGLPGRGMDVRRFFRACLLSSVRRISNADPSPVSGVEITKLMRARIANGYEVDVHAEFDRRVELTIKAMDEFYEHLRTHRFLKTQRRVMVGDSKKLPSTLGGEKPDLILFSPPYCNAIEYWRRHRLEYILGGFLSEDRIPAHSARFVGRTSVGRSHAFRKLPPATPSTLLNDLVAELYKEGRIRKAWQIWHYFNELQTVLRSCARTASKNAQVAVVVGDSVTGDRSVPTTSILEELGEQNGLSHATTASYPIRNRVMQFPTEGHSKIREESIILYTCG